MAEFGFLFCMNHLLKVQELYQKHFATLSWKNVRWTLILNDPAQAWHIIFQCFMWSLAEWGGHAPPPIFFDFG